MARNLSDQAAVEQDVATGIGRVLVVDGQVAGIATLVEGPDPHYLKIDGAGWLADVPYLAVHRFALDGIIRGHQLSKVFFSNIMSEAYRRGVYDLRVDTCPKCDHAACHHRNGLRNIAALFTWMNLFLNAMLMRFVWHTNRKTRNGGDRHAGHWQLGTDLSHNACFSAFKPIVEYARCHWGIIGWYFDWTGVIGLVGTKSRFHYLRRLVSLF